MNPLENERPERLTKALIAAGFLPLPWFLFWTAIAGALVPDYHALAQHASELSLLSGAPRYLLDVAAIGSGIAFVLFAVGIWLLEQRFFALGALLWITFGTAMISDGIWAMGGPKHGLYGVGIANIIAPAISLLEIRPLRDDKTAFVVTAVVSVSGIVYLWLALTGNDPQTLRGFTQRVFSSINSLWPATIAYLLLRGGRRSRLLHGDRMTEPNQPEP